MGSSPKVSLKIALISGLLARNLALLKTGHNYCFMCWWHNFETRLAAFWCPEAEGGSQYCDDAWRRGEGVKDRVTSCTSHLRQGLARESWMIALYALQDFMVQHAWRKRRQMMQPVSPTTAPGTDGRAPSNVSFLYKNSVVVSTHRSVGYATDCKAKG